MAITIGALPLAIRTGDGAVVIHVAFFFQPLQVPPHEPASLVAHYEHRTFVGHMEKTEAVVKERSEWRVESHESLMASPKSRGGGAVCVIALFWITCSVCPLLASGGPRRRRTVAIEAIDLPENDLVLLGRPGEHEITIEEHAEMDQRMPKPTKKSCQTDQSTMSECISVVEK